MEPCIYSGETNIPSSGTGEIDVRCNCRFKIDRKGRSKFSKRGESPSGKRYPYSERGPPFVSNRIIRIIGALLRFFRERAEDRGERVISPFKHWGKRNNILASSRKRHRYRSNNRVVCVSRRFLLCGIRFAGVGERGEKNADYASRRTKRKKERSDIYIHMSRVKEEDRNSCNWQPRSRFNLSLRNGGEGGCEPSNAVASSRVMSLIRRNVVLPIPVFVNYRLIAIKVCIQVFQLRDLIGRAWKKKRKNRRVLRSAVSWPSRNKWKGGDGTSTVAYTSVIIAGEMKQGAKSKFRATISGKIDELPVGGQPVLCP